MKTFEEFVGSVRQQNINKEDFSKRTIDDWLNLYYRYRCFESCVSKILPPKESPVSSDDLVEEESY